MKKNFKFYIIIWAVLLGIFNLSAFLVPSMNGENKFTTGFWIAYALYTVIFVAHLVYAKLTVKDNTPPETFYSLSFAEDVIKGGALSFAIAIVCMALSFIPYWLGVIACALVLALTIVKTIAPKMAVNEVERIDKKIKTQTFFIKSMTIDAETLMESAKDEDIKAECRKVAEAFKYSDPMSNEALASAESAITIKFATLQSAVQANDKDRAITAAQELVVLIGDRNKKCKLLK